MVQQNRERGTLQSTLPKSPFLILFLYVSFCTAVATFTFEYSRREYDDDVDADVDTNTRKEDILKTIIKASIGSISGVVGILYTDPFVYGLLFSFSMLGVILINQLVTDQTPDIMKFVQYLSPLLATFILSKASPTRTLFKKTLCSFATSKMILNQFNLMVLCTLPLFSLVIGFCQMIVKKEEHSSMSTSISDNTATTYYSSLRTYFGFSDTVVGEEEDSSSSITTTTMTYFPSLMITIAAFLTYHIYYTKRSHKNGGLMTEPQIGSSVIVAIGVLYFVTSTMKNNDDIDIEEVLPFLLGSVLVVQLGAFFAFVADFWYAVGTGQFLMVSLDTAGILFYFVAPVIILLLRFFDKYQHGVQVFTNYVAVKLMMLLEKIDTHVSASLDTDMNMTDMFALKLQNLHVAFMTLSIVIGIPLIQYLCPIAGHLFGRTYTHGNPNTKKVAICVNFSEYKPLLNKLSSGNKSGEKEYLKDCILNIFVTANDLTKSLEIIKKLDTLGHNIGILLGPTITSTKLKDVYKLYETSLGKKPTWCHTGIQHGNYPSQLHAASKLGLRTALWSTLVHSHSNLSLNSKSISSSIVGQELSNTEVEAIKGDIDAHGGGSIFYFGNVDDISFSGKHIHASLKTLLSLADVVVQNGCKATTLSEISQDNRMDL